MSRQQGLFLAKTVADKPFIGTLDAMCRLKNDSFIRRLIIPHSQRISILAHLLEHNTHEIALFPDADGLGRFRPLVSESARGSPRNSQPAGPVGHVPVEAGKHRTFHFSLDFAT